MQRNTDKKTAAFICAAVVIALMLGYLAVIMYGIIGEAKGEMLAVAFLLVYGAVILAVILGVILALRQRFREIEGGEEDEAKKY